MYSLEKIFHYLSTNNVESPSLSQTKKLASFSILAPNGRLRFNLCLVFLYKKKVKDFKLRVF
jgi:hypothetical protein